MKIYVVDAFTNEKFGGNPAGIAVLDRDKDFPSDTFMQKLSAELRYSETAFIKALSKDTFHIRYFTPVKEVDLCGHATIAAFSVLREEGIIEEECTCYARTLAGKMSIDVSKNNILMDMSQPEEIYEFKDMSECVALYKALGLDLKNMPQNLRPEIISTGLPDIILPVDDREALNNLMPNFKEVANLSKQYNVVGIHAFALPNEMDGQFTAFCRNFAPLYGIDEESATGTANGALTYYLKKYNCIEENQMNAFLQGETMGRPSIIKTIFSNRGQGGKIRVGGNSAIILKGKIHS